MFENMFLRGMLLVNNACNAAVEHLVKNETEWDFLSDGGDGGVFSGLVKSIQESGASLRKAASSAAFAIISCAIIILGIKFVATRNGGKLEELKGQIPWVLIGVIMVVGFTAIFYFGQSIADGIVESLKQV